MIPYLAEADSAGNIRENPKLLMAVNRCGQWILPKEDELIPLPPESDLFMLPGRQAVGFDGSKGQLAVTTSLAVAAFPAPGHTLSAHAAYLEQDGAPVLPLFAYGAVGFAHGRFWIAAKKVDEDQRQEFRRIKPGKIEKEAAILLKKYPRNRLVGHIIRNCVRRYHCPAARNFALGRYEAPLPTSRACNAKCVGCISQQDKESPIATTPQCRLAFSPTPAEVAEVMAIHEAREKAGPIYSFGQGCEGDPLCNASLLYESISFFRKHGGKGTINCNCNGSRPEAVALLAKAGLTSMRVSMHSARPDLYEAYHRPEGFNLEDVRKSLILAREAGIYTSLNLLYFPGITDTWAEIGHLAPLVRDCGVSMIQLRNLNIDPGWYSSYLKAATGAETGETSMGLAKFMKEMKEKCPWLRFGYFNPYLGDRAQILAPPVS